MTETQAKRLLDRANKAESKYTAELGNVEREIADYVEFDFSIIYHPSDGMTILNKEDSSVAPLDKCLGIIAKTGVLTSEQHKKVTI